MMPFDDLSFAQERVWLLDQLEPSPQLHNIPMAVRLFEPVDEAAFAAALRELGRRHPVLTSRIALVEGRPAQAVLPKAEVVLRVCDLTEMIDPVAREQEAARLIDATIWRRFDLASGDVARTILVRLTEHESIFVFVQHHIATDGWSVSLLMHELARLYTSRRDGRPHGLLAPPIQYVEFARWQRRMLGEGQLENQFRYWRRKLAGGPRLHYRGDPNGHPSGRASAREAVFDGETTRRLRTLAAAHNSTPFVVLLAALNLLAARTTGESDVILMSPFADRPIEGVHATLGCFLNVLPLRTRLSEYMTFFELLQHTRETVLEAMDHVGAPLEKILADIYPGRRPTDGPPSNILVNAFELTPDDVELPGLSSEAYPIHGAAPRADLGVYLSIRTAEVRCRFVFDDGLFESTAVEEFVSQYVWLLEQALVAPDQSIWSYSLVTAVAKRRLPDPTIPLPTSRAPSVSEMVAHHALTSPDAPAMVDASGAVFSYRKLEELVAGLAHLLRRRGVEPGQVVAIEGRRTVWLPVAVLGVMRAGGVFLVLDGDQPPAWLDSRIRQAAASWLIRLGKGAPLAATTVCELPFEADACRHLQSEGAGVQAFAAALDTPACIGFTSGSTGRPLPVVGAQGALTRFLPDQTRRYALGMHDRFAMLSSLGHDPLQRDIFTALWTGGLLCVPPTMTSDLGRWVADTAVSVINLSPSMIPLICSGAPPPLPDLRLVFLVGEPLRQTQVNQLRRLAPNARLVNLFGATETQRALTEYPVPEPMNNHVCPIGAGQDGVQALVLTRNGGLAGIGEPGELHVRSSDLALGYLDDVETSARRFVTLEGGHRAFRTGDLARYRLDGSIEIFGRIGRLNKVAGQVIDFHAVDAALLNDPDIADAFSLVLEDERGHTKLAAYIVISDGRNLFPSKIRKRLRSQLPFHCIPSTIVKVRALPRTSSGKVDAARLPGHGGGPPDNPQGKDPPRTPLERELARLWAETLRIDEIGRDDDFFTLGGDSLGAMLLTNAICRQLGHRLNLRQFVRGATVSETARALCAIAAMSESDLIESVP